jgi:hypothetical protein
MNISDEAVWAAGDVMVYHQRRGIKGCACGWSELGRSHAEHQARLALEAAAPHLMAEAWERGRVDGYHHRPNPYKEAGE